MDYRDYLVTTTAAGDALLEDWRWLTGPGLQLWRVTKSGQALLRDAGDGSIYLLDTVAGRVERIAGGEAEFEARVGSAESAEAWLMRSVVDRQAALGMRPGPGECLSFVHPPALGGGMGPENFETCDAHVHLSLSGQIHRQIKDLPVGTRIGKIEIQPQGDEEPRPWWKFW